MLKSPDKAENEGASAGQSSVRLTGHESGIGLGENTVINNTNTSKREQAHCSMKTE